MKRVRCWHFFAAVALPGMLCLPLQAIAAEEAAGNEPKVAQTAAESSATLQQLGQGILRYLRARGRFPELKNPLDWEARRQFYPYVRDERWFLHPATEKPYLFNEILSHKNPAHIPNPQSFAVFYEPQPVADELRAVLFLDGHVERVKPAHWEKIKKASKIK